MPKKDYTPLLQRLGLVTALIAASVGFWFLSDFETRKAQDTIRMAQLRYLQDALLRYYTDHAVFPWASQSISLGDDACLSTSGFVSIRDVQCVKKFYAYAFGVSKNEVFLYTPLERDGQTPCKTNTGCPWYTIRFLLETNSIFPKGEHILTPTGIQ